MKIFKNRFGRQPLWWHILNLFRVFFSIFFKNLRKPKAPKYKVAKNVGPQQPKKWAKRDIRPWSPVFLSLALAGLTWLVNYQVEINEDDRSLINGGGTESSVANTNANNTTEGGDDKINILSLELEQIENLANTIAGKNAIWPGYKGEEFDHRSVNRHFNEQFAKFINSGIIPVEQSWSGKSVAFAYAVGDNGVIQFVGKIPGGDLEDDYAYVVIQKGISGQVQVIPAQDEGGENIIMLYYIKVRFAVQ